MIPIDQLLARIRWDTEFGRARFVIGYWDRVAREVRRVDLKELGPDAVNRAFLDLVDEDGVTHEIPLHRVREVWRDGLLVWQRTGMNQPD